MKPVYKDMTGKGNTSYRENQEWLQRYKIKPDPDKHYVKVDDTAAYYGRVDPNLPYLLEKGYSVEKTIVDEKIFIVSIPLKAYNDRVDAERAKSRSRQIPQKLDRDMISEVRQKSEGITVDLINNSVTD